MKQKILVALLLSLSSIGCSYPTFINPIVDPEKAERIDELFGTYRYNDSDKKVFWLHIEKFNSEIPKGFHKLVWVKEEGGKSESLEFAVCFFKVKDSYILQLPSPESSDSNKESQAAAIARDWKNLKIESYLVLRLKQQGSDLRVDTFNEEFLEKLVEQKKLTGSIEQEIDKTKNPPTIGRKSIIVTAETEELAKFFSTVDLEDLFKSSEMILVKQLPK